MKATLQRFCSHPDVGTFGVLRLAGFECYTVERPWRDNKPWLSCVPQGVYLTAETYYVRGDVHTIELLEVPNRTRILIHKGNLPTDVQGCIAVGSDLGTVGGRWAVTESAAAFANLVQAGLHLVTELKIGFGGV